jgi:hypothetical protein
MLTKRLKPAVLLTVLVTFSLGAAELPTKGGPERKGPLADMPSKPGTHMEKIKALGDNQWVCLGSPAPDPKWGKMTGRSWGAKMAYAPDLVGAFMVGEGPHGHTKPNGYQDDDVWFYDVNGHRWICIHPGSNTKAFAQQVADKELKVDAQSGNVVDKDGQPIPIHTLIHAWGNLSYNTDEKKFAWQSKYNAGLYFAARGLEDGIKQLQTQGLNGKLCSPWFYDTVAGKFERYPVSGEPPFGGECAENQFLYIPSKKQFFSAGRSGAAFFDPAARKWTEISSKGFRLQGIDHAACYDSKRDCVYLGGGVYTDAKKPEDNFFRFDIKTCTWSKPNAPGDFPIVFSSNYCFCNYDSVNDAVVIVSADESKHIYVYDPQTNSWSSPPPTGPKGGYSYGNGFYSPEVNAYFFHFAHDGDDNGVMWAYRYKNPRK